VITKIRAPVEVSMPRIMYK